jgi:CO/xanthine dehydrogenase FAD-binding subunit
VKPAPFDYVRAGSVEDAVAALAAANSGGEGKVIAGGQSLMPLTRRVVPRLLQAGRPVFISAADPDPGTSPPQPWEATCAN